MKFVLKLEKDLNIKIEMTNDIESVAAVPGIDLDDIVENSGILRTLHKHATSRGMANKMRVNQNDANQVYDALAGSEINDDDKQTYIKFLIDFYVSKNQQTVESIGFLSGMKGFETFGANNVDKQEGLKLKDLLESNFRTACLFSFVENENNKIDLLWDANLDQMDSIKKLVPGMSI